MKIRSVLKRALEIWWEFKKIIGKGILVALLTEILFSFYIFAPSLGYVQQFIIKSSDQQGRITSAFILFFILFTLYLLIIFLISRLMFSIYLEIYGCEMKPRIEESLIPEPDGRTIRFGINFYKLYFLLGLPVYIFSYLFFIFPLFRPPIQGVLTSDFSRYFLIDTVSTMINFLVVSFFFILVFLSTPYAAKGMDAVNSIRRALTSINNRMGIVFFAWISLLFVEAVSWFVFSIVLAPLSFASIIFSIKKPGFTADLVNAVYSFLISAPKGILWSFIIICWFLIALFLSDRKALIVSHDYDIKPGKLGGFKIPLKRISIVIGVVLVVEIALGILGGVGITFFETKRLQKISSEQLPITEIEKVKGEPLLIKENSTLDNKLNSYLIEADINTSNMGIKLDETIIFKNTEDSVLKEIYLNVFSAAYDDYDTAPLITIGDSNSRTTENGFIPGKTEIKSVRIDNTAVNFSMEDTHLKIVPGEPVQHGDSMNIQIELNMMLPKNSERFGYYNDVISLGNWIPLLAVYEDGGWRLDKVVSIGDPFYSETADFKVTIRLPANQIAAATGLLQSVKYGSQDENKELVFRADGVRDFAVMISRDYKVLVAEAGETEIYSYYLPNNVSAGENARNVAIKAFNFFSTEFGEYPFREYEVVENLNSFGGMEYPCLVQIGYLNPTFPKAFEYLLPDTLIKVDEYIIAHETSHQWWYSTVGNDQVREPWLDEALAEYSTFLYFRHYYGEEKALEITNYFNQNIEGMDIQSKMMSSSIYNYISYEDYSREVYVEGSQVLLLLEREMGQKELRGALREYYSTYMFGVAGIDDFISICQKHSKKDLNQFFIKYYK